MTDLLTIAEAQIAEKQYREIQAIKERLDKDKENLKQAIELINSHTLYKRVNDSCCRGRYKYVLATEEMLKEDYLKEPEHSYSRGISFHRNDWRDVVNRGILKVNGETYYDIRYALNAYEEKIKDKESQLSNLNSMIKEIKDDLSALYDNFPSLKQAITEYMEWQKKENNNGE